VDIVTVVSQVGYLELQEELDIVHNKQSLFFALVFHPSAPIAFWMLAALY
jgi:hypothetical protein